MITSQMYCFFETSCTCSENINRMRWCFSQSASLTTAFFPVYRFIIRLEAKLSPNIGFTQPGYLAVFNRSAITPPKVSRFGRNLEHSENIVGSWPDFGRDSRSSDSSRGRRNFVGFLFCRVNNARFHRFPVGQI